jgi:uncharacterized membrane protein HdeD (DUF308 family)
MKRHAAGLIAARIAAPYLTAFLMMVFDLLFLDHARPSNPLELLEFMSLGILGFLFFGIPLLLLSSVLALALSRLSRHPPSWQPMIIGGVLGLCFVSVIFTESFEGTWTCLASGALAGAICGWIYWRIAIGRTPPDDHAIKAA